MNAAARRQPGIALPRWLSKPASKYVTRAKSHWQPEDVALAMALALRLHGTIEAVRATARRLADLVCPEQRPKLVALSRKPSALSEWERERGLAARLDGVRDEDVRLVALRIINRVCDLLTILPEVEFTLPDQKPLELVTPPRCHMKPMRLAGPADGRHWQCQHCSHTKPIQEKGQ